MLGRTYYTVGLISGGVAPNVISPAASAEVLFRTVGPGADIVARARARLRRLRRDRARARSAAGAAAHGAGLRDRRRSRSRPTSRCSTRWGQPLLYGPGSILDAHTADEHVEIADLEAAVAAYHDVAGRLLAEGVDVSR